MANKNPRKEAKSENVVQREETIFFGQEPTEIFYTKSPEQLKNESKLTEHFASLKIANGSNISRTLETEAGGLYAKKVSHSLQNGKDGNEYKPNAKKPLIEMKATENENGHSDVDSDDDSFFNANKLFPDSRKLLERVTFMSAPTDSFPCADESDGETDSSIATVKFRINKSSCLAVAEYEGIEYRIGYLDLTTEECSYLKVMAETTVELAISSHNINIQQNRLNIRRIHERHVNTCGNPHPKRNTHLMWETLNLGRVQFSRAEPFLAKYENELYFVGYQLNDEYMRILERTKMNAGTAIRINKNRLKFISDNTLEITKPIPFENQNKICVISAASDFSNDFFDDYASDKFHRYLFKNEANVMFKVDPALIQSSKYDDCAEIYAEEDFPFTDSKRVCTGNKETQIVKQEQGLEQKQEQEAVDEEEGEEGDQDDSETTEDIDDEYVELFLLCVIAIQKKSIENSSN